MKKTNLLYFCSDYQIGLTQALTEQVEYLSKEPSINLFCISSEKEQEPGLHERVKKAGVNMTIVRDLDVHANLRSLADSVREVMVRNDITHVNVHNNWQLAILAYLKMTSRLKFKLIYTIHGYRHNHPVKAVIATGVIGGALMMFADRVISMSSYVTKKFRFVKYKTDTVYYMMNKPEYNKEQNEISTSSLSMVFPAQFRNGKRQEMLIDALRKYVDITGDRSVKLHLPGDGPTLPAIKELVNAYGLSDNVVFYGKLSLSEVLSLYNRCNIALCSSNVETYGRCIAEPFMLGRCLITQKTGVAEDIIRHGENGYFFSTAEELADILVTLHRNPGQIRKVADTAFADRKVFFPQNVMTSYLKSISKA